MTAPKLLNIVCNMSEHCDVVVTTLFPRREHVFRGITTELDLTWSQLEFGGNKSSAAGGSWGITVMK